jgi:hypothetical protein
LGRVEIAVNNVRGRETDEEFIGAVLGNEFVDPVRWMEPNVLILQRHEYFQKLRPASIGEATFEEVHSFSRGYELTATMRPDRNAAVVWKVRKY